MNVLSLPERDLLILGAFYLDATRSAADVAKSLKLKPHTVTYVLNKLLEEGVLTPQPFINTYAFGYFQAEFFVSLGVPALDAQQSFERIVSSSPYVPWVGRYGGAYQYGFTFCVRTFEDLFLKAGAVLDGVSGLVRDRAFAIRNSYTEYQFKNLTRMQAGKQSLSFGICKQVSALDDLDHRILKILSRQPHFSRRLAADRLGVQASTFHYRLVSLQERGILAGFNYVVDFAKLGLLTYLYLIRLRAPGEKILAKLRRFAADDPDVIYISEGLGAWDIKIAANVRNPEESMRIPQSLAEQFGPYILDLQTLSAFAYSKVTRYPFEELPD